MTDSGTTGKHINWHVNEWSVKQKERDILRASNSLESEQKSAWLLRAVTLIDLTTLGGDDTGSNVNRLCMKAITPISSTILNRISIASSDVHTAAVCVYPSRVENAVASLTNHDVQRIPVAAVATGFPSGQYNLVTRLEEIKSAVRDGASEIDIVIDRSLAIAGKWDELERELIEMKAACGGAMMKTILAVGELPTLTHVYKASMVAMQAGSDFIKTSTGKETTNATIPVGIVMARAIRDFYALTGKKVGLKAAGGLRTPEDAIAWLVLVYEELGKDWLRPNLFRIGASSLLASIEAKLHEIVFNEIPDPRIFTLG